jgi:hypothetical protein
MLLPPGKVAPNISRSRTLDMNYSQPPPSPLEVGHAQISTTDILVQSFGLKDGANIELLRDFVDRVHSVSPT